MRKRLAALLAARFASTTDGGLPWAAIVMQFLVAGVLCGLVGDALGPYPYAVFALAVAALLVAVPLFGEAGTLLFADEARAWIESLPVRGFEIQLARRLHALFVLGCLSLGSSLPAALFAPDAIGGGGRAVLVVAIAIQTFALAGLLLALLACLGGRANSLLVLLQTAIFAVLVAGSLLGLRAVFTLADVRGFAELPDLARLLPPAWFAWPFDALDPLAPGLRAAAGFAIAAAALVLAPAPRVRAAERGGALLGHALAPLRWLARTAWVRKPERASFEFVFDALPREPEFALRTYPLLGIPLAFLLAGVRDDTAQSAAHDALFALLLFTPAAYLPLVVAQLPASRSHRARWIFDTAPLEPRSLANGAFKALGVRFVVPLWLLIGLYCAATAGPELALRWTPPALLFALFVLRRSFAFTGDDPPLSRSPDELESDSAIFQSMLGFGLVATFAAVCAAKFLTTWPAALFATVALFAIELATDRTWARSSGARSSRASTRGST